MNAPRPLTAQEARILQVIQEEYGPQNTREDVAFTGDDEAFIFVTDQYGVNQIMVSLTNLALFCDEGIIKNDDELRNDWLARPG